MRGWLVVLMIVAAAAGAALYLLQEPEARERSRRGAGGEPSAAPGDAPPGTQPKRTPEGGAEEAAPKARMLFEGKLVNEDKEPVAGVVVTVRGWQDGNYETVHGKATSDEQGRFNVDIEAFQWVQCETRHALYQKSKIYVAASNDQPVEIILRRGAPVSLTVVDARGTAVADAKVIAWIEQVYEAQGWRWQETLGKWSTDAQGGAALGAVAPGKLTVAVDHPSFAPARRELRVRGLDPVALEFVLDLGGAVEGHVTDRRGTAVAGARVRPVGDDKRVAVTDGKGHYRLEAVAVDGVRIVAEADGYGPGWFGEQTGWGRAVPITVRSGETIHGIDIVLGSAAFVRGRIVDEAGKPVEGIGIGVGWSQRLGTQKDPKTDAEGRFVVGPFALDEETEITLWFNSQEYVLPERQEVKLQPAQDLDLGDIKAGSRATVRGRVLDVDGTPLMKGSVSRQHSQSAGVKPDGTFELKGLSAGKNTLTAYGPPKSKTRSRPVALTLEQGGVLEDVELRLEPTFSITGRVVTPDGRPRQAGILAVKAGTQQPFKWEGGYVDAYVYSQKDGTYELLMLLDEEYEVGIPEQGPDG
ncbi:MAG: carboxypeptidase regulatory-like domain-containing protein, partial [Planctomycetota bacterium]|nr:carboxypeptidase regulatory-like domain-containing protein [Planctomycetota bacterium]